MILNLLILLLLIVAAKLAYVGAFYYVGWCLLWLSILMVLRSVKKSIDELEEET